MFYALSKWPELYKDKIKLFIALAPAVNIYQAKSPLFKMVASTGSILEKQFAKRGTYELFGQGWSKKYGWLRRVLPVVRSIKIRSNELDIESNDKERNKMLMGHFPHGTSARSLNHLGQLIKTG